MRKVNWRPLTVGIFVGAALNTLLFLGLRAAAAQGADEINVKAIYFSWWYVAGTMLAFLEKIFEGVIKHEPDRRFSWRKLTKIVLVSLPFLLINVFFFLPKFGPTTGNWQTDSLYAFLTSYATLGIGSSLEDFRRWLDFHMFEPKGS